jgi:hypothetical protein
MTISLRFGAVLILLLAAAHTTHAQAIAPHGRSHYERTSGQNNPALSYFASHKPVYFASPSTRPARSVTTAAYASPAAPRMKPFAAVQQGSTVSPYLALDVLENGVSVPNYYAFVRPQLEQQRQNRVEQAQYFKGQQQFPGAGQRAPFATGSMPTTGHSTQFMNHGTYFQRP